MAQNPNAMDVPDDGYETDDTIIVGDVGDGYTSDEVRRINEYYDEINDYYDDLDNQMALTPPRTNPLTPGTPPTRLLMNTQIQEQVYKRIIEQDGTMRMVPFTSADYSSGEQPYDTRGRPINQNKLPYMQPRRLFEEKEGGASRRRSKRRRAKKSLRKRRYSRKRKTKQQRKGHSRRSKK